MFEIKINDFRLKEHLKTIQTDRDGKIVLTKEQVKYVEDWARESICMRHSEEHLKIYFQAEKDLKKELNDILKKEIESVLGAGS